MVWNQIIIISSRSFALHRPANSRYALILLQRHEKSANRRCTMRYVASPATQRDARADSHSILIAKNSIKNNKLEKFAFRTLTLHKALRYPRGAVAPRNVCDLRLGVDWLPIDIRARPCAPARPSSPRSRLRSTPSRELVLYINFANPRCTMRCPCAPARP